MYFLQVISNTGGSRMCVYSLCGGGDGFKDELNQMIKEVRDEESSGFWLDLLKVINAMVVCLKPRSKAVQLIEQKSVPVSAWWRNFKKH